MAMEICGDNGNLVSIDPTSCGLIGTIAFLGKNAKVTIGANVRAQALYLEVQDGSSVYIDEDSYLGDLRLYILAPRSAFSVGKRCNFTSLVKVLVHEVSFVTIGDDCLFASDVSLSVSDMHSIFDRSSGERINKAGPISIGDRVWLCENVKIMKNVNIGHDSVVAACSIVTKSIPEHTISAGSPAKVVKKNVVWSTELLSGPLMI